MSLPDRYPDQPNNIVHWEQKIYKYLEKANNHDSGTHLGLLNSLGFVVLWGIPGPEWYIREGNSDKYIVAPWIVQELYTCQGYEEDKILCQLVPLLYQFIKIWVRWDWVAHPSMPQYLRLHSTYLWGGGFVLLRHILATKKACIHGNWCTIGYATAGYNFGG